MRENMFDEFKNPNPFGIRSVVIRNMKRYAKNQYYKSSKEFEKDIDLAIDMLQKAKKEALEVLETSQNCPHKEFKNFQSSLRRSILDYYTHYEKTCANCGFVEYYDEYEDGDIKPDWVKEGLKEESFVNVYYNNHL